MHLSFKLASLPASPVIVLQFFQDGRIFDGAALVEHMVSSASTVCLELQPGRAIRRARLCPQVQSYRFLDGMEGLLQRLKESGYELHAMSNYPIW